MSEWQVSQSDIIRSLEYHGIKNPSDELVDKIQDGLDQDAIEKAIQYGEDMLEKTELAECELNDQVGEFI